MADDPTPDSTIRCLLTALEGNNWPAVKTIMEKVEAAGIWRSSIMAIVQIGKPHPEISTGFHTLWTVKGHRIREQVLDDGLLRDALRILLPAYDRPGLTLYRGESVDRWRAQAYGFAWTNDISVARMFARGLNATVVRLRPMNSNPSSVTVRSPWRRLSPSRNQISPIVMGKRGPRCLQHVILHPSVPTFHYTRASTRRTQR